jgi:hypothetical protein
LSAAVAAFAADANEGTWKLNEAKSKISAGATKNTSVVYTADGDNYKCVVEGVDGKGQPIHNEWTGKFDGKEYPVTGDLTMDTRAITKVDDRHYKIVGKKDSKVTSTGSVTFSTDGKTRTLVLHRTDEKGKKLTSTYVYDKQ